MFRHVINHNRNRIRNEYNRMFAAATGTVTTSTRIDWHVPHVSATLVSVFMMSTCVYVFLGTYVSSNRVLCSHVHNGIRLRCNVRVPNNRALDIRRQESRILVLCSLLHNDISRHHNDHVQSIIRDKHLWATNEIGGVERIWIRYMLVFEWNSDCYFRYRTDIFAQRI